MFRKLIFAGSLTVAAVGAGFAVPASASQDFPPYVDCASALSAASGGTGRLACFDKFTPYGPIFQVFSNWGLYYAAPYTDLSPASLPNHLWYGAEWQKDGPLSYPVNGRTIGVGSRTMRTGNPAPPGNVQHRATSTDPGLLSWWYYAAEDASLNVVWLTH